MTLINAFFFLMLLAMAGVIWLILDGWWGYEQQNRQAYSQLVRRVFQSHIASHDSDRLVFDLDDKPLHGACDAQGFFLVAKAEASTKPLVQVPGISSTMQNKDAA